MAAELFEHDDGRRVRADHVDCLLLQGVLKHFGSAALAWGSAYREAEKKRGHTSVNAARTSACATCCAGTINVLQGGVFTPGISPNGAFIGCPSFSV